VAAAIRLLLYLMYLGITAKVVRMMAESKSLLAARDVPKFKNLLQWDNCSKTFCKYQCNQKVCNGCESCKSKGNC